MTGAGVGISGTGVAVGEGGGSVFVAVGGTGVFVGSVGGRGVAEAVGVADGVEVAAGVSIGTVMVWETGGTVASWVAVGKIMVGLGLPTATAVGSVGISPIAKKMAANTVKATTTTVPAAIARFRRTDELFSSEGSSGEDTHLPHS